MEKYSKRKRGLITSSTFLEVSACTNHFFKYKSTPYDVSIPALSWFFFLIFDEISRNKIQTGASNSICLRVVLYHGQCALMVI